MTTTDLKLKYCSDQGIGYTIFSNSPYGDWLEEQLLILIKNQEDVERFKEGIVKLEEKIEGLERELDEC